MAAKFLEVFSKVGTACSAEASSVPLSCCPASLSVPKSLAGLDLLRLFVLYSTIDEFTVKLSPIPRSSNLELCKADGESLLLESESLEFITGLWSPDLELYEADGESLLLERESLEFITGLC